MLTLPIKRHWFNKIVNGEKKEEYRDCTPYYAARFDRFLGSFKMVLIRAGYAKNSPMALINVHISKGIGRSEWGAANGTRYYVLTIIDANVIQQ